MADTLDNLADELLSELIAKGHQPKLNEEGTLDLFAAHAFDADGKEHDGPRCLRCGEWWCAWCPFEIETCEGVG